jgi:integrase
MAFETHTILDGKVHVYKRENSRFWQCSTYLGRRNHRQSTKEENLSAAKDYAHDWYMERYVEERRRRRGELAEDARPIGTPADRPAQPHVGTDPRGAAARSRTRTAAVKGPTFKEATEAFSHEYEIMTQGERNAHYVKQKADHIRVHLLPFFGDRAVGEITAGLVQDYRVHRATSRKNPKTGEPMRPARSTLHSEIVTLRQILKTANRKGWIEAVPDMSAAYKASGKVSHRAWFSPDEYKLLYEATRERAKNPKNPRWKKECEQLHDYVLFMVNTGMRPDEASNLQFRDVQVRKDESTGHERILEIEVRGKRGVGYCKSMPGAVLPFQRVQKRRGGKPTDLVFGKVQRELLNTILDELNLKHDRQGNERTAYSLRHTYISMRLMEGADIYQVAKNCRTSVEMIEKHYAAHIRDVIDTRAVNVRKDRRPEPVKRAQRKKAAKEPVGSES